MKIIILLLFPISSFAVDIPSNCVLQWDYPEAEDRHIGFQLWDKNSNSVIWDTNNLPQDIVRKDVREVSCSEAGLALKVPYLLGVRAYNFDQASPLSNTLDITLTDLSSPTNFRLK